MHARMVGVRNTQDAKGERRGRPDARRICWETTDGPVSGLSNRNCIRGNAGFGASPSQAALLVEGLNPVACDTLWFDYRCGGSAGIARAFARGSPASRNLSAGRTLTAIAVN